VTDPTPPSAPAGEAAPSSEAAPAGEAAPSNRADEAGEAAPSSRAGEAAPSSRAGEAAPTGRAGEAGEAGKAALAVEPQPPSGPPAPVPPPALPPALEPDDLIGPDELTAPSGGLWQQMRADPQYAPEHLALEAVRRLGPPAQAWAERMRAIHPGIHPDILAQWAIKRFLNHARLSGAVSGAAGLPGAVVDVGVLAWTQARMVLHVAAAYGFDPTQSDRATDLLVLQRVHKVAQTARLALGVAAGRERAAVLFARAGAAPIGRVMLRLGAKLAHMAGVRAAKRIFAKVIPGASIVLGTWANSAATTDLARRAVALYGQQGPPAIPHQRQP
jgi:hypothetical protein